MSITYNNSLSVGKQTLNFRLAEAAGYLDGGLPAEASSDRYALDKQPGELLTLEEGFGRVLFDLSSLSTSSFPYSRERLEGSFLG